MHEYLLRLLAIDEFNATVDMKAYPGMYGIICKYQGQVAGNVVRWLTVLTYLLLGAARPDAMLWRRALAGAISSPWRLLANLPGYR